VAQFYACNKQITISSSQPACLQRILKVIRAKYPNDTVKAFERCSDTPSTSAKALTEAQSRKSNQCTFCLLRRESGDLYQVDKCARRGSPTALDALQTRGPCIADVTKAGRVHSSCSSRLETPTKTPRQWLQDTDLLVVRTLRFLGVIIWSFEEGRTHRSERNGITKSES
jgi:hypothetical protein